MDPQWPGVLRALKREPEHPRVVMGDLSEEDEKK